MMSGNKTLPAIKDVAVSLSLKLPRAIFIWFLISWAAGYFGMWEWRFELASHFKLQYLFGSLAFGLFFAALKQWRWLIVAALCALISGFNVAPWYFPNSQSGSGHQVRLLLSNVWMSNSRYEALTDLIRAEEPDLLFIQEVTPPWAKHLETIRDQYPHGVILGAEDEGGIASLSRLPLIQAGDAGIGDYNGPSLEIRLNIGNRLVHIINTHTLPPMGKLKSQRRNEHFEVIAERMNDLPTPKVLIGDLNATMWSPYFKRLVERTELVDVREGFGVLPTWPAFMPLMKIPIDHCLVSRDIRVVGVRTGAHIGSDHLPLIVDLAIPGAQH
jgi:endonuclease/exonuclease/phosphatase (EEP) superfamily protein YafD